MGVNIIEGGSGLHVNTATPLGFQIQFDNPQTAEILKIDQQGYGPILIRPFLNNNVQIRLGVASLLPGSGLKNLYGDRVLYDVFSNIIFLY